MDGFSSFPPPPPLNTAVLFLVFNRLETAEKVFHAIRMAKPPRLYIAADGPRNGNKNDIEKTNLVRNFVINNIDWDCQVKTLFRSENVGCKNAVTTGISWFFEHEEQGIILEDDCLPSQSFFWYCEALLDKYYDNNEVFLISGDGRNTREVELEHDYGFTKFAHIWGWATWRRTWINFDLDMKGYDGYIYRYINEAIERKRTIKYIKYIFKALRKGRLNQVWDYQFVIYCLMSKGLCIVPSRNLISNLGHGPDATHTLDDSPLNANVPKFELELPLNSPAIVTNCALISDLQEKNEYNMPTYFERLRFRLLKLCKH